MSKVILHHCPQTRSMRSLWLLHELGIEFEVVVHRFDKSLRDPSYLAISPAGRVPSLEIDGAAMIETGAIAEYLCERFPGAGLGRAPGDADRMEWLVWIHFAETISQHAAALTQQHLVLRDDAMRSPAVMTLEAKRIGKCFDTLEKQLVKTKDSSGMLLASGFSAADISIGQAVYLGQKFCKLDAHPEVAAWFARLEQRSAFQASLPDEQSILYREDFYPPWEMT